MPHDIAKAPFYPETLQEEPLKAQVARDFFGDFYYEPLENVDFTLKNKNDTLGIHYLLWAEAKAGSKEDIFESLVQLILTIGVQKIHKKYTIPEFIGAFDCEKIAFAPYHAIKDFLYSGDFNWKKITPSDHTSEAFVKMASLTKDILKEKILIFDYAAKNAELKAFIANSLAKGKHNPIAIDADNFDACYLKWSVWVLPSINLKSEVWKKARKQNIALEQDFFLADLISKDNVSLKENLRILLQKRQRGELYYRIITKENDLFEKQFDILEINFIDETKHADFWKLYERPPAQTFWREIFERRDKITPRDIMERKGAFFTPKEWVKKAQDYLAATLGKGWENEYYIWDCAAGTGNLLKGLTNSANIYASTLDLSDVLIMKDLCEFDRNDTSKKPEEKLNLLQSHIFAFDFLNDDFSKLPKGLRDILNDENSRKKLIIFINPPYAEASSATAKTSGRGNKAGVSASKVYDKYIDLLGRGANELFAQFFIRIQQEIQGCILASFSTLKYVNSANFVKFRQHFKAKFKKGFCVPANSFDNVNGNFPIGFVIWDLNSRQNLKEIRLEVFEAGDTKPKDKERQAKTFFAQDKKDNFISDWIRNFYDKDGEILAWLTLMGADFQSQNSVYISMQPTANNIKESKVAQITPKNLIPICVYLAVRQAIKAEWLNNRDQFLYPNDKWQDDIEFQNDCLAFTLFHPQNRISGKISTKTTETPQTATTRHSEGAAATEESTARKKSVNSKVDSSPTAQNDETPKNHFIPFSLSEVGGTKESFASNFMFEFINGKIKPKTPETPKTLATPSLRGVENAEAIHSKGDTLPPQKTLFPEIQAKAQNFIPTKPLKFSVEAKKVFEAGRELYKYYHAQDFKDPAKPYNANASLYDIKEHFQGRDDKGKMNPPQKASDPHYKELLATLNLALRELATKKIKQKIYDYGFLRE